eukprot:5878945-Pyramimonas_sp.AAC.1
MARCTEKVGRWIKLTTAALGDMRFWQDVHIKYISRSPVIRLHHWLMKGDGEEGSEFPMLDLVYFKVGQIALLFDDMFTTEGMRYYWGPLLDVVPDTDHLPCVLAEAVIHCLEVSANFHRRFVTMVRRFPHAFLWLVFSEPTTMCTNRQLCAADLLDADPNVLDDASLKLRALFNSELEAARNTGYLDDALYRLLVEVALAWCTNTRELEGMNNTVKSIGKAAPHIGWKLLSARATCKKDIEA